MSTDDDFDWKEYGLFIDADGLRATDAPWKLWDYDLEMPLSEGQIAELATAHKLEPSILQDLSKRLSFVLNPDANIHVVPTSRSKGRKRAAADLSYAEAQLGAMITHLEAVFDRLAALTMDASVGTPRPPEYPRMLDRLERAHQAMMDGQAALEKFAKRPELFVKQEPLDKRYLHDRRRDEVLGAIFQAWVEAGREISFTTDPLTSKRGGALVWLAQDVCAMLTDPPTQIGGETIAKLISKRGKSYRPMAEWGSVLNDMDE